VLGVKQYLQHMPSGQLASMVFKDESSEEDELILFLKEDNCIVKELSSVGLVCVWVTIQEVVEVAGLVVELVSTGHHYELWIDYKTAYGKKAVDCLCTQSSVRVDFVGTDGEILGQIVTSNTLKDKAIEYREVAEGCDEWLPAQFRQLKRSAN